MSPEPSLVDYGAITGTATFNNNWSVENYGTMQCLSGEGGSRIINHGTISDVSVSSTGSVVNLEGAYIQNYLVGDNEDHVSGSIENAGRIDHVSLGIGADVVNNSGVIEELELGAGVNAVTNTGEITTVSFGDDFDSLTNLGTIDGVVGMGGGDDVVDTAAGAIVGRVDLGDGRDGYTGGAGADRVIGGAGDDIVDLGAGDDQLRAGIKDGNDAVDGGDGNDTYSAAAVSQAVLVDLSAGVAARGAGAATRDIVTDFTDHGSATARFARGRTRST